jgi:hypothetical protein
VQETQAVTSPPVAGSGLYITSVTARFSALAGTASMMKSAAIKGDQVVPFKRRAFTRLDDVSVIVSE